MADSVAFGNVAIEFSPSCENFGEGTFTQQISPDFAQRLAGIKDIAIGVHSRKHRREALEIAETQKRLDGARRSIDRLDILFAALDDFSHELEIARIFDQAQIGQFFLQRALRRKDEPLLAGPIQNALDFADIPLFDHGADGDGSRMGHARSGQRDVLHNFRQGRRLGKRTGRVHGQRVEANHQTCEIFQNARAAIEQSSIGDEHDRTKTQAPAGPGNQLLDIRAQSGLAPGEHNGIGLAANHTQKAQRFLCRELVAKDVRLFLRAITAGQVTLMRGVENQRVGRDDVGPQHLAPAKIGEIEPEVFERQGSLIDKAGDQLARRDIAVGFYRWHGRILRHLLGKDNPHADLIFFGPGLDAHDISSQR